MLGVRLGAGVSAAAFAILAVVLAAADLVAWREAVAAGLAALTAFLPSAWLAPAGFRRRTAELALLPPAFALTLLADPTQRALALPPLLLLAALAALLAARSRVAVARQPLLLASFALSLVAATSLSLTGFPTWRTVLAALLPPLLSWVVTARLGFEAALVVTLLTAPLPWVRWPLATALALLLATAAAATPRRRPATCNPRPEWLPKVAWSWLGGALALALLAAVLAPYGLLPPYLAFPNAAWFVVPLVATTLLLAPHLPPAAAGAAWLAVALALGPPQPPPAERPTLSLTAASPTAQLPPGSDQPYILDLTLANAATLPAGSVVGTLVIADRSLPLHVGAELAEWAILRPTSHPAHGLPDHPVFRPRNVGAAAFWSVANRLLLDVPPGVVPTLTRTPFIPDSVILLATQAGPARPTPPRDWSLPGWLLATALTVATLQLTARTFTTPFATLPWALLTAGTLAARLPVEPLRLLAERHAPDLALAAFLLAWFSLARRYLTTHPFLTATTLLLPLALATPHLTPPMYGDEPFHLLMMESLTKHHSVDLERHFGLTYELARLSSPGLAALLLPGFLVAGRFGALALLALAGAGLVGVLARRASQLGLGDRRLPLLLGGVLLTYPLGTFCTQIWVEVPGALAAATGLIMAAASPPHRWWAAALAAAATGVKTRLALVCFPPALAAWWPGRRRAWLSAALALGAAAVLGTAVGSVFQGHPFGPYRRLHHLVPAGWRQVLVVLGGLTADPAGGMLFAAPLALLGLAGLPALWRRGSLGERGLLVGGVVTVLSLLHSLEWYGGGSPPFRYLVPFLPLLALAWVPLLQRPRRLWRLAWTLVPPTLVLTWALIARPPLSVNPGMGAWWLSSALARRLQADTWTFFPSFLRLTSAAWAVPLAVAVLACLVIGLVRWRPRGARFVASGAVAIWLVAAAALVVAVRLRSDRVVEGEAPQVIRRGGSPEPKEGTFSMFTYRNGWRLADGQGMTVPLKLGGGDEVFLTGWLEGPAREGSMLRLHWADGPPTEVRLVGNELAGLPLVRAPAAGRTRLYLDLAAPAGGFLVVDRLEVRR
ncbi:MAG: hypothetical protein KA072_01405 [Thermoanaerobaculaceae bacterium]|nr:hypothetical protein [Thermoanaerobaculaceae bacterium]